MFEIEVVNQGDYAVDEARLQAAAQAVLDRHEVPENSGLSIAITDDEAVAALNKQYRGVDSPTDVLSFPASETDPDTGASYIGDILISIPRAQAQADAAGHPLEAEVQLLVVHGVLHLLGYDHADAEEHRQDQPQGAVVLDARAAQDAHDQECAEPAGQPGPDDQHERRLAARQQVSQHDAGQGGV